MVRNEGKDKINSFPYNSKTHSTLKEKKYVALYAEDLHFLITRAGWLVNHIYEHFTFSQSKFKKDFVVMNQKARQTASSSVKKDFYKLLNNSNFDIVCRNKIDNCHLDPLYDDFPLWYLTLKNSTSFLMMIRFVISFPLACRESKLHKHFMQKYLPWTKKTQLTKRPVKSTMSDKWLIS